MKFTSLATLTVLAWGSLSVNAQYFSEGWKPGQPARQATAEPQVTFVPGEGIKPVAPTHQEAPAAPKPKSASLFELLDPEKLLGNVLVKLGFNVSSHLEQNLWDERIPLITDDNYNEIIANEQFASDEEARDRTWVIAITVTSKNKQEPLSKLVDEMFDSAFSKSVEAGDLPNVRWGRMDYFNVTYITTKWNVWKAPYLVILKDRGQTLHFFRPGTIRVNDDALREFLLTEGYMRLPPWSGAWAPGGQNEWILDIIAIWMTKVYNLITKVPKWILFIVTGSLGSVIISFLHRPPKEKRTPGPAPRKPASQPAAAEKREPSATPTPKATPAPAPAQASASTASVNGNGASKQQSTPTSSPSKRSSPRQRKGKKAA